MINITNAELIKSMTSEELAGFLFNVEFIRALAYPEGKTYGSYPTLKNWLDKEVTMDIGNRMAIMEYQNKKHHEEIGISKDKVNEFYGNLKTTKNGHRAAASNVNSEVINMKSLNYEDIDQTERVLVILNDIKASLNVNEVAELTKLTVEIIDRINRDAKSEK